MNKVLIGMDRSGSYRLYLTITTGMVSEAMALHHTSPTATTALGRVLTGTGLMSLQLKEPEDRLTVQFRGDGPARSIVACGYGTGQIKGYIEDPAADLPQRADGKLDVGGLLGTGELTVVKDIGLKEPYSGTIALVSGEIAEDLTAYYYISEQQNTSIALGVKVSREMEVTAAGGMFIQMLPQAEDGAVDALEAVMKEMKAVTSVVEKVQLGSAGLTEEGMLTNMCGEIFGGMPEEYMPETLEFRNIELKCDCSGQRIERALMAVGSETLKELIEEDGEAELSCRFCGKKYHFDKEELEKLLAEAQDKGK
jgi:Disulfide bond chaperones of the HSP33 family